jgi:hypothetical protein
VKHACLNGPQTICQTTFFVESTLDTTRSAWCGINCRACLLQGIAASEARTIILRDFLAVLDAAADGQEDLS